MSSEQNNILLTSEISTAPPAASAPPASKPIKHKFVAKECPINRITVFRFGNALIVRDVKVKFEKTGEQLVVIKGMTNCTIANSIRASGVGHATIQEVTYKENVVEKKKKQQEQLKPEIQALEQKIEESEKELKELLQRKDSLNRGVARLEKERSFITKYSNSVLQVSREDKQVTKLLQQQTLEQVSKFMEFQVSEEERIHRAIEDLNKEIKELDALVAKVRKTIGDHKQEVKDLKNKKQFSNQVIISVNVQQADTEAEFQLQYMVTQAEWSPSYDIRVNSTEQQSAAAASSSKKQDADFKVTYFGIIKQNSGEDWIDAAVSLSTAANNSTTEPPKLDVLVPRVQYRQRSSYIGVKKQMEYSKSSVRREEKEQAIYEEDDAEDDEEALEDDSDMSEMPAAQTQAEQGSTSSLFHIPRASTIPSDNQQHKLTVAVISLDSKFSYFTVPKADTNAYLKVKTTNKSDYVLLPGPTNVFVDGNFVSSGRMSNINPGEEFDNFLGVDPAIKVVYKAPSRFKESLGLLVKTQSKSTITRKITIKNTKLIPVTMILRDQIPQSTDEKIKVQLQFPDLKGKPSAENVPLLENAPAGVKAKKFRLKGDSGFVEWTIELKPSEEVETEFKYNVTWPAGNDLDEKSL